MPMRVIAKKRCRVMVEPPEKGERASLNPNLSTRAGTAAGGATSNGRQVNMTISLAFLAPNLVKAAVEGRLPRGLGVERLRDAPAEWSRQFETLGLNPQ